MANNVKKVVVEFVANTAGLDQVNKKLDQTQENVKEVEQATDEAAKSMEKLAKSTEGVAKAEPAFKSLKQQIKEARNDATSLAQRFGETSKEALAAANRVATLTEELDDFNQRVKALNPEAKFNAVSGAIQGTLGGLQGLTGALQLFGSESEEVEKIAQKLQGALNLAQGVNSVLGLKDAFANLRVVLGLTSAAQTTLATASTAAATGQTAAAAATRTWTAALLANPLTAVAVALAAVVAGIVLYNSSTEEAAENTAELNEQTEEQIKLQEQLADKYQDGARTISESIEDQRIRLALALGQINELTAKLQQNELNRRRAIQESIREFGRDLVREAEINKKFNLEEQIIRAEDAAKKISKANDTTKKSVEELIKPIKALGIESAKSNDLILTLSDEGFAELEDVLRIVEANAIGVKKSITDINEELAKTGPIGREVANTSAQLNQELFASIDAQREEDLANLSLYVQTASALTQGLYDINANLAEADAQLLQRQRDQGLIDEKTYQQELRKIKQKVAEDNKKAAIFSAILGGAGAIINALNTTPPAAVPAAVALASILSAVNIAKILTAPIPKFKKGALNIGSGNADSDGGSLAIVHPGEAVIPADRNKAYHPAIKAIFNRKISPKDINAFVTQKLQGRIGTSVKAEVDTYGLARVMRKNNSVNLGNADYVANAIGKKVAQHMKSRQH